MEKKGSVTTFDRRSNGTMGSRLSNLTSKLFSFRSRAEDCVSRSSRSSILSYKWDLYMSKSDLEREQCKKGLRSAIQRGDKNTIQYYEGKLRYLTANFDRPDQEIYEDRYEDRYEDQETYSPKSNKTDTMRVHGRPKRSSISEIRQSPQK